MGLEARGVRMADILTDAAVQNALVVRRLGGSTNFVLHLPAIVHAGGLKRPAVED